ncbi:PAS domain-containing protein [Wenxinia saemankumensis]|uniref:PAS domain S-box-containing protein n=1 Tax=Wenxinia saemankumensis TaxID=1447782 RepID=A0A1M6ANL3_9RHOB|nr:PAS domain-containing protein [Wenxinia saemankumensis]SHI37987.1 PAS domain S-box-containing protein [Wenxinia saemankumensis]
MPFLDDTPDISEGVRTFFDKSTVALVLADDRREDCPLVGVNDGFLGLSGYDADEVLGRNCRFMQPEGGAGPVRDRMRAFIAEPDRINDKFVVPNVRRSGERFLSLVYMTKLSRDGRKSLILGSQFDITRSNPTAARAYDDALSRDLRRLSELFGETNFVLLGTYESLASSQSLIVQARLDG